MPEGMTEQQLQIVQLLSQGRRTSEIAKRLSLSFKQVSELISDLKQQTRTDSTEALIQVVMQQGSRDCHK